jgi:apolipoprotein N-acyltransferase
MGRAAMATCREIAYGVALGGISGGMCVAALTPYHLWPLAPLAFAPLAMACRVGCWPLAVAAGTAHGVVMTVGCLAFVLPALHSVAELNWAFAGLLWATMALGHCFKAVTALLIGRLGSQHWLANMVTLPAGWVLAEWGIPVVFPWPAAIMGEGFLPWLQLAELGGPLMVSAWIVAAGAGVATTLRELHHDRSRAFRALTLTAGLVIVVTLSGIALRRRAEHAVERAPVLNVGVIQGAALAQPRARNKDPLRAYRQATLELLARHPRLDFVVWPESLLDFAIPKDRLEKYLKDYVRTDRREGLASRVLGVPVLLGLSLKGRESSLTNSAVLFDAGGGVSLPYDKRILMPLGEAPIAVAFGGLGEFELLAPVTRYRAGKGEQPIVFGGHRIAVMICYEDMIPGALRVNPDESQPELLVSLTSDSWFVGEHARRLHAMLASLRAVESRRFLLRVTQDGMSALVSPTGQLGWSLPLLVASSGVAQPRWLNQVTLYRRCGDTPMLLLASMVAMLAVARVVLPSLQQRPKDSSRLS